MASPLFVDTLNYDSGRSDYWNTVTVDSGTIKTARDPNVLHGSVVQMRFARSEPTGVREDLALIDLHMGIATGAGAWSELNDADAAAAEATLDTLWTTIKTLFTAHIILDSYVWRHYGADYPLGKTGLSKPSPIWRTTARTVAGTAATVTQPDQIATSVTFRTASRRHWGRVYLPALATGNSTAEGRMIAARCDTIATAFRTALVDLNDNARQCDVFVWSPKYRGQFSVSELAVDDVYDVIRSRRAKVPTYKKVFTS